MNDNVGQVGDVSFAVPGHGVHYGSTHITEYIVHSEGEGGIELDDFTDQFAVVVGPVVDGFEDVGGHRIVGLQG